MSTHMVIMATYMVIMATYMVIIVLVAVIIKIFYLLAFEKLYNYISVFSRPTPRPFVNVSYPVMG